ncbi:hypothetical protein B1C78_10330 [Thioalkalivibrio denitrificans]|uniref:Lipoprotein n=1 Tax=Thioalkalivibrio denitrificans TaxID=108003 RepID=A0A1V3NFW8_9GAMM|nr:hypothetical protein [Thioalkalivibrio denitrificans]OOG23676.1 hypothetical protein B1C78_10330 [Thioalkalivibrio denitrificans]
MNDARRRWLLPILCCLGLLAGACGGTSSIETLDDGRYAATARGYHDEAGSRALDRAEAHCAARGLRVLGDDMETRELDPGFFRATLIFRCVEEDHPDLPAVD